MVNSVQHNVCRGTPVFLPARLPTSASGFRPQGTGRAHGWGEGCWVSLCSSGGAYWVLRALAHTLGLLQGQRPELEVDLEDEDDDEGSQNEDDAQKTRSERLHSAAAAAATSSSPQLCSLHISARHCPQASLPTSPMEGKSASCLQQYCFGAVTSSRPPRHCPHKTHTVSPLCLVTFCVSTRGCGAVSPLTAQLQPQNTEATPHPQMLVPWSRMLAVMHRLMLLFLRLPVVSEVLAASALAYLEVPPWVAPHPALTGLFLVVHT